MLRNSVLRFVVLIAFVGAIGVGQLLAQTKHSEYCDTTATPVGKCPKNCAGVVSCGGTGGVCHIWGVVATTPSIPTTAPSTYPCAGTWQVWRVCAHQCEGFCGFTTCVCPDNNCDD